MRRAIVIGAGIGGLAGAALLASKGFQTIVFEKNASAGGKMQQVESKGYRFDTGPSLFTMPFILENLFEQCGKNVRDYLQWQELSPLCKYFYKDGVVFNNYSDRLKTAREIEQFAPEDAVAYNSFLNYSEDLYSRTADAFLFNPLYDLSDLKSLNFTDFLKIDAFSTVSERIDQTFSSPYLRQFFKRFTTYNGSSPFQAPATLNVIPHVELNQGGYYVDGGLYSIARALQKLCEELGVTFRFNTQVDSIAVKNRSIQGIKTSQGQFEACDILFSNSDATDTICNLLPQSSLPVRKREKQSRIEPSCSGFVLTLGCNRIWEQLVHHNIFFSGNYRQEFTDIFENQKMPDDPTIYVANTSYTDTDHAPPGSSNLFILVNAPFMNGKQDWSQIKKEYRTFIIEELEKRGLENLSGSIDYSEVIGPDDFYEKYRSNRGSIYGTSSNSRLAAFLRPRNSLKEIDNLYLVGGSTHPGGGIPLVIQSAFNAIQLLERSKR
ncbi:phytoene desaturase [Rhodohalobacter sp. SW132]|uniref:phytoene desaturase family protein n=1 Tax=Rhodohalobacter sp. SW132 TaxID=2293433 RepID=UPI000E22FE19|nr:phytoene desaturase family protein [Rhodohalobacter sp. SW132]REL24305.1 phytoene desaturase [Rhodohalobacter sp. SW132]